jgi:hypothetical protein
MTFIWELLAKVAVIAIDVFLKRKSNAEGARKDYLAFVEIMNRAGISSARMRKNSEAQIGKIEDAWATPPSEQ